MLLYNTKKTLTKNVQQILKVKRGGGELENLKTFTNKFFRYKIKNYLSISVKKNRNIFFRQFLIN